MSNRRKRAGWRNMLIILFLAMLGWLVFEGRFYFPRKINAPKGVEPIEVELSTTSYCHCRRCCSYSWFLFVPYQRTGFLNYRIKHIGKTSSGAMVRPGTIAADTSLFPYGTVMYIPGYGYGRVEDTGGAVKGMHIDLYRPNHWYARKWGVQNKTVTVWYPAQAEPALLDCSSVQDTAATNVTMHVEGALSNLPDVAGMNTNKADEAKP